LNVSRSGSFAAVPIRLQNDRLVAEVLPDRGMTITRLAHLDGGENVLWERPGHVAPPCSRSLGPAGPASIQTLHELLVGGWFEMSPLAGLPGTLDGEPTLLHGEAMRLPWAVGDVAENSVEASVQTVHGQLELSRRIELDGETILVSSTIRNAGSVAASTTHGEHPCFDRALFGGGSLTLSARSCAVLPPMDPANASLSAGAFTWPQALSRHGGTVDLSSIPLSAQGAHDHVAVELAEPEVEIRTRAGLSVTLRVDLAKHPFLLLWRNLRAPGTPGNGLWDVFALEPMSSPGATVDEAVEAGAVRYIAAGEEVSYSLAVSLRRVPPA
jgi:galactose mutarotase-like enzyme